MGKRLEELTVSELKERLRKKGLPVSGKKADLITRLRNKKDRQESVPENVLDPKLYRKIREKIKKRVKVWPSAYASGQLVTEYKRAGGRYTGGKKSGNLDRWYREKWVNVCDGTKCGREKSSVKDYPYCRPTVRVNSKTPMTVSEIRKKYGTKKLKEMCVLKRKTALPKDGKPQRVKI